MAAAGLLRFLWPVGRVWIYNLGAFATENVQGSEEKAVSATRAKYTTQPQAPAWETARTLAAVIALLGIFVAGYMSWAEVTGNETACVETETVDCAAVQQSVYAQTWGIPVAILGLVGYVAILGVLLLEDQVALLATYGRSLVVAMALFGVMFQTYLTYIEANVLHKWCQWCVASYVLITALFVLGVYRLYSFLQLLRN